MESIDHYVVREELARGNMGVVYRAHDPKLGRDVALKVMLNTELAGATELTRFRTEAQVTARLRHPNIVPILGAGVSKGRPYLAMELVEGESLAARLKRVGALPPAEAARIAERIASALGCAHQRGIVHRDVKPENVLLDERGEPQLTDFGIAKVLGVGKGLTVTGEMLGTPYYMAPEAAHGEKDRIGPATDVYSLGVTLFHMLTGDVPFRGTSMLEVLDRVVSNPTTRVRERTREIDPDLDAICADAMAKAIEDRIPNGDVFAERLAAWSSDQAATPAPSASPLPLAIGCGLAGLVLGAALILARGIATPPPEPPPVAPTAPPAAPTDRDVGVALIDEARVLAEGGQPNVALRLLTLAERFAPRAPTLHATRGFAIYQRDGNKAGEVLNEHLSKAQALDPGCASALLREARRKGVPAGEALRLMNQAVALEPTSAWLHYAQAVYFGALEDPAEAERGQLASLDRAIEINPRFVRAYLARARVHEAKGRPRAVIEDAEQVLRLDPRSFAGHRLLAAARLHKSIGQTEQALHHYLQAAWVAPTPRTRATAFLARAAIHAKAVNSAKGSKRRDALRERALQEIDRSLRSDPSYHRAFYLRGKILESRRDFIGAINALDGALERVDAKSADANNYRQVRKRIVEKSQRRKQR